MTKRKAVVIWVAFDKRTGDVDDWATSKADIENFYKHADRYVKYVPANPDDARVVREAVALCTSNDPYGERLSALCVAVERREKRLGRR